MRESLITPSSDIPPEVTEFVRDALSKAQQENKGLTIGRMRGQIVNDFCKSQNIDSETARGLLQLVAKFDRVKRASDLEALLTFALWLKNTAPRNFFGRGHMTYLADDKTPLPRMLASIKENYIVWTKVISPKLYETSTDKLVAREGVWKAWLPVEGYYLSLVGGSGSGTFSVDVAIGFDETHSHHDMKGQIWRVGFDLEVNQRGERVLRIIRTGSGHKSNGDPTRADMLSGIRSDFLDAYKVSPQRLLLFLVLEIGYTLGFQSAKALSTEGAMALSLLSRSKHPLDYTASMTSAGFTYTPGNWHTMDNFQERYYEILAGSGYEGALKPHEVRGFDMILKAFNDGLKHVDGEPIALKLERDQPEDLERAWDAYARLHSLSQSRKHPFPKKT